MVDMADILNGVNQRAQNVRAVGVYDQAGGYQQSINQIAAGSRTDAALAQEADELLVDMSEVQRNLANRRFEMQTSAIEFQEELLSEVAQKNEGLYAARDKAVNEISEDATRMAKLEEDDTGFFENPIKYVGNRIRYNALRGEVAKDTQRANLLANVINSNYDSASRTLQNYRNTVYMKAATALRHEETLARQEFNLRQGRMAIVSKQNQSVKQAAAQIAAQTRNYRQDTGIDQAEFGNPVYLAMNKVTGNQGPLTAGKINMFKMWLATANETERRGMVRAGQLYSAADGSISAEQLLAGVIDNGTAGEAMSVASILPSREIQQAFGAANREVSNRVRDLALEDFKRAKGLEDDAAVETYMNRNGEKAEEELLAYRQTRMEEYSNKPASEFISDARSGALQRTSKVINWTGSDFTAQAISADPEFIEEVVAQYIPSQEFINIVQDPVFRTGLEGSSGSSTGLADKAAFMTDYFVENANLDTGQAAELTSTIVNEYNKGKVIGEAPELVTYSKLTGDPVTLDLRAEYNPGAFDYTGEGAAVFDLSRPVDLMALRARYKRSQGRQDRQREALRKTNEALSILNPGYGFVPERNQNGNQNNQGN